MRDLQKDLELCNAATPGPWKVKELIGPYTEELSVRTADDMPICEAGGALKYPEDRANARFIAEAREGWPEAIRRAMAAEARVKELEAENRQLQNGWLRLARGILRWLYWSYEEAGCPDIDPRVRAALKHIGAVLDLEIPRSDGAHREEAESNA